MIIKQAQFRNDKPVQTNCKKIQNYIFNLGDIVGQGNFSKVYRGQHQITKQIVAIKVVELKSLTSSKLQQLLFSQVQIIQKLSHPNILRCHDVFTSNRNCYIVTQLCNGGDLQTKVRIKKTLTEQQAQHYIMDIFYGLTYLAEKGIVHRDLKIANIFVHNGQAKIADFGFAKNTKTRWKDINIGSPIYMSPEGLIYNFYSPKTDIWAFGILIYELLHGQTPFSFCKSERQLKQAIMIPVSYKQLNSNLSNQMKEVILKCLEVQENKRITAQQLGQLAYFKKRNKNIPKSPRNFFTQHIQMQNKKSSIIDIENLNYSTGLKPITSYLNSQPKQRIKTQQQIIKLNRDHSDLALKKGSDKNILKSVNSYYPVKQKQIQYLKETQTSPSKFTMSVQQNLSSIKRTYPTSFSRDLILSIQITFKQCVNILHYCRLLFKHIMLMKEIQFGDQNQLGIFKRWLSTILKTLVKQINEKKVHCEGDNSLARQKKLQQVTSEYVKKYSKQLNLNLDRIRLEQDSVINYDKISSYFLSIHQMIDQAIQKDPNNKIIMLGHSIILIVEGTRILNRCFNQRNYKQVQKFRQVEQFLGNTKSNVDFNSYTWYKKKYLT